MHSPVKLQGVGPGGAYADGTGVAGTVIDGSAYQADAQSGTDWFALASSLAFGGNQNIYEGETLMVVANDGGAGSGTTRVDQFRSNFPASIDGLKIMGGRHDGFPNNRDPVTGAPNGQTATRRDPGRRHLRQRPGALPADHERRDPGQQRRLRRRHPARHPEHRLEPERQHPHRLQPHRPERRHEPGGRSRHLRRRHELPHRPQHAVRQQLGRVRRRDQPLRPLERRQDRPQPHLVQPQLRRGRRGLRGQ